MTDPIQGTSSIPLPKYQTTAGDLDPLPTTSPREIKNSDDTRSTETDQNGRDNFATYLDQSSITNVELNTKSLLVDTAEEIRQNSVYQHPASENPI